MEFLRLAVNVEELTKAFPSWFPMNEWTLRSFLIKNPNCVGEEVSFLGCEICNIDLIFESDQGYYILETKADSGLLSDGLEKLKRHYYKVSQYTQKKIFPILAFINKPKLFPPSLEIKPNRNYKRTVDGLYAQLKMAEEKVETLEKELKETKEYKQEIETSFIEALRGREEV